LKETSEAGIFYLKSLLDICAQNEENVLSKDDLCSLKEVSRNFIESKQKARLHSEANRNCHKVAVTGSWRREEVPSNHSVFDTAYESIVSNLRDEASADQSEEFKRLLKSIETFEEGEVVSSVLPTDEKQFICPLSQKLLVEPVKNKECLHTYSKEALVTYLKNDKNSKKQTRKLCPVAFCDKLVRPFQQLKYSLCSFQVSLDSIEPNYEMERLLRERSSRQQERTQVQLQ
jgi:hypothetical protein